VYVDGTTRWCIPGGGAIYAALGMALWDGGAAVVAPCGPEYPREAFPRLDFSRSRTVSNTMRNWGLYEADGTRVFVSRRDSLPWERFSSDVADLDAGPYAGAHLAPMPWTHLTALIDALRARGAGRLTLDCHERVLAETPRRELFAAVARVDAFLPSRQDVDVLFPGLRPLDALRALRAHLPGLAVVGVKCGGDGAILHARGDAEVVAVPSAAPDPVVDATGAGDAFCGGFLAALVRTGDVVEAALHGTVAASFAVEEVGPGALARAARPEAETRLDALRARVHRIGLTAA
jgi:sugar/nucleoside kinase (ribokinase family)